MRLQLLTWILLGTGCVVTREAGAVDLGSEGPGESSTGPGGAGFPTTSETSEGARLDLGAPDVGTESCVSVGQTSTIEERPSDIIIAVDAAISYAMSASIFENFSLLIADGSITDVRVIMLAPLPDGGGGGICIQPPPLGTGSCPTADHNPPIYFHVDQPMAAATLLEDVLASHPMWADELRPEAWKHLWVMSGADPVADPADFVDQMVALDPTFDRLTVHAMVPDAPRANCSLLVPGSTAEEADALIALANATEGVVEPLCNYDVGVLFDELLERIQAVALSCRYDIPDPPDGQIFDAQRVNVDYDDGFGLQTIGNVEHASDCVDVGNGWYYDDPAMPTALVMCPQTCARFEAAEQASIEIRFGCATIPAA